MYIYKNNPINSYCLKKSCNISCRNRNSWGCFSVLSGITIIRDNNIDFFGRSSSHSRNHKKEFHKILINWGTGGLNNIYIFGSDIIDNFDADFAIIEAADLNFAQIDFKDFSNLFSKCFIGVAGKNQHIFSISS